MEALEHSCFFRRSIFCSSVFFKLFLKLHYSDIIAVCRNNKNREAWQITHTFLFDPELYCLIFFICLWCNKRVWTQSLSINCLQCST